MSTAIPNFVVGQRWVSNTEPELGLGIISDVDGRSLSISFPAAAEQRAYAADNAPLSRIQYRVGEQVTDDEGNGFIVSDILDNNGYLIYLGKNEAEEMLSLPELELNSFVQFSRPKDRLFSGQIDKLSHYGLRYSAMQHQARLNRSGVEGLLGGRVQLLPHQLYIANEVGTRYAPRVLLADEVGLGKTIEAGLILHQQLVRGTASRALVVVPDSLIHQWLVELKRRFNLSFTILDEARCQALEVDQEDDELGGSLGVSPLAAAVASASEPKVGEPKTSEPAAAEPAQKPKPKPKPKPKTDLSNLMAALASAAEELQLEQGGEQDGQKNGQKDDNTEQAAPVAEPEAVEEEEEPPELENPFETTQLALCALSLFEQSEKRHQQAVDAGWDLLVVDEAHHLEWSAEAPSNAYSKVEALAEQAEGLLLLTATPEQLGVESHFARLRLLDPDRYHSLDAFLQEQQQYQPVRQVAEELVAGEGLSEAAETALVELGLDATNQDQERLLAELLDRSGTGRVLFRNTRGAISGFPQRRLHCHSLAAPQEFSLFAEGSDLVEQLHPERLLGSSWLQLDPRVSWLTAWLKENRKQKALVICAEADTVLALEEYLRLKEGIRTSAFHEGMSLLERDRAGAYFADDDGGAQVLICSEIGSEGRNFQFAQHLILLDLPLNPDLLEQRIGRLDRIGQLGDVNIHVPFYADTAQQRLLDWYDQGIGAFKRPFPAGQQVLAKFGEMLRLELAGDGEAFAALIDETRTFVEDTLATLEQGRNRLLELSSCQPQVAAELIEKLEATEQPQAVADFMEEAFDQFGIDTEEHSEQALIIRPSDEQASAHFPALPEDGVTGTYDRNTALSRDDIEYLSWEHPMVAGVLDMVINGEHGNTAFGTLKVGGLPAGTLLVEMMFALGTTAPKSLQLNRYIEQRPLRLLLDSQKRNLSKQLSAEQLNQLAKRVSKHTAQQAVRQARAELETVIQKAEQAIAPQQDKLIAAAQQKMQVAMQQELERLEALAKVNPNIRQSELDYQRQLMEVSEEYLAAAKLNMVAVRVLVVTA